MTTKMKIQMIKPVGTLEDDIDDNPDAELCNRYGYNDVHTFHEQGSNRNKCLK
jgi:hypothetical protein